MFIIAKKDKDNKISFLYKNRKGIFLFTNETSNVFFNTEEEVNNFIQFRFDKIKHFVNEGDKLYTLYQPKNKEKKKN